MRINTRQISLAVGETEIELLAHQSPGDGLKFISLHDDENTAVEAAVEVIGRRGGTLFELHHTGERNITFRLNGASFTFDPNRIFTDTGIEATLRKNGPYTTEAGDAVRMFARTLLDSTGLARDSIVISVHNNTAEYYSVLSYIAGGEYERDAERIHRADGQSVDNFFFLTTEPLFRDLARIGYNVVLQDNRTVTDDGSLSVFCGQRDIPYINVEAGHGAREAQVEMLLALYSFLRRP